MITSGLMAQSSTKDFKASRTPAASPKTVLPKPTPKYRDYVIFVLTTESRIPKRYIVRYFQGYVTTATPLVMYFNDNRLKLYDADMNFRRY